MKKDLHKVTTPFSIENLIGVDDIRINEEIQFTPMQVSVFFKSDESYKAAFCQDLATTLIDRHIASAGNRGFYKQRRVDFIKAYSIVIRNQIEEFI